MTRIYLIGSLRNPQIPEIGNTLRRAGFDVFDDWFAGGKIADDEWQAYEKSRGRHYSDALYGFAARHVYDFDRYHIDHSDLGVLVLPAGKSGHLELGFMIGTGRPGFVFFPDGEPERWDVMYQFARGVAFDMNSLLKQLHKWKGWQYIANRDPVMHQNNPLKPRKTLSDQVREAIDRRTQEGDYPDFPDRPEQTE